MYNIMNSLNPKYTSGQNKRYDEGMNMSQLADPGLPFIKQFKDDIRDIGEVMGRGKGIG